jgi:hypothetical protein
MERPGARDKNASERLATGTRRRVPHMHLLLGAPKGLPDRPREGEHLCGQYLTARGCACRVVTKTGRSASDSETLFSA